MQCGLCPTAKGTVVSLFVNSVRTGIAVSCRVLWLIPSRFKKQYRPRLVFGTYLLRTYNSVKEYTRYVSSIFLLSFLVNISREFFWITVLRNNSLILLSVSLLVMSTECQTHFKEEFDSPRTAHVLATELKSVFPLVTQCFHVKYIAKPVNKISIKLEFKAKWERKLVTSTSGSSLNVNMLIGRPSASDRRSAKPLATWKRNCTCGKIVKLQKLNRRNCSTAGKKFKHNPTI